MIFYNVYDNNSYDPSFNSKFGFACVVKKSDNFVLFDTGSDSETLIENFLKNYKDVLKDFNGEISHFKSFSKEIMNILSSKFGKFKDLLIIEN